MRTTEADIFVHPGYTFVDGVSLLTAANYPRHISPFVLRHGSKEKTILTVDQIWRTILRVRLAGAGAYAYQTTTAKDSKTRDSSKKDQLICYQGTYPMFPPPHGPHTSHVLLLHVAAYINILWQGRSYSFVIHKARAKSRPSSDEFIRDTHFKFCLFLDSKGLLRKDRGVRQAATV